MNEREWVECTDPEKMLKFLRGRVSVRKFRLYLCGGCRQFTHLFFRPESLAAVEVAERFVEGGVSEEELHRAEWEAEEPTFGYELGPGHFPSTDAYRARVVPRLVEMGALPESALAGGEWQVEEAVRTRLLAAAGLAEFSAVSDMWLPVSDWGYKYIPEVDWPGRWLFDCVFGSPFRTVSVHPSWLTPTVQALALAASEERQLPSGHLDPVRLGVLADALEDAGCDDPTILAHLRGPGPHVRGCWCVDLLLGKQ
jgi:hypothetical protein